MVKSSIRLRCPCCGRLGWISQFKKSYTFEVVNVFWRGGRAKKNFAEHLRVTEPALIKDWRAWIFEKIKRVHAQFNNEGSDLIASTPVNVLMPLRLRANPVIKNPLRLKVAGVINHG